MMLVKTKISIKKILGGLVLILLLGQILTFKDEGLFGKTFLLTFLFIMLMFSLIGLVVYNQFELNDNSFIAKRIIFKNKVYKIQDIDAIYFMHIRGANVKIKLKNKDRPSELLYNAWISVSSIKTLLLNLDQKNIRNNFIDDPWNYPKLKSRSKFDVDRWSPNRNIKKNKTFLRK